MLWLIYNLPSSVLLWTFLNRKIRAVGPLVLIFMMIIVAGANLVLAFAGGDMKRLQVFVDLGVTLGLDAHGIFIALILLGCLLFAPIGLLLFRWIRGRYQRKKMSDQSLAVDAIWLLFCVMDSIYMAFAAPAWILSGFVAFFVFKMITWIGFSRFWLMPETSQSSQKLLLLRVFALGKRSEQFFDALGTHWRYLGSIQMIAGPDLATTNIDAHEFMDFLSGKLARRFIDGPQALDRRISETDLAPDRDRRYRVNEFFCYQDTWKTVLSRLVKNNDAVLMDLRGFSPRRSGCIFEINELINAVPLERVVFVIDQTTDESFLRQTAQAAWQNMRATSPNRDVPAPALRLFRLKNLHPRELSLLLRAVCAAAHPI